MWEASGKWDERGRGALKYAMCRIGDTGPYAPGNVYIATNTQNAIDLNSARQPDELLAARCLLSKPKPVPAEIADKWTCIHDAILWSYENRTHPEGKPLTWLAHHLNKRRPHLSRLIHRQDLKLDAIESHVWDCLIGWTAIDQYVQAEKRRMNALAAESINNALKARFAA